MTIRSCLFIGLLDVRASLDKLDVPAAEQAELADIVNGAKDDILATP